MAKLVCTLEMSKERGVTITVANADGKITQTVTMDGTTLCLKVAGEEETSTWTQTADAIKIACKDFEIAASNSIKCTATETIALSSDNGDTSVSSGAKISQTATTDFEIAGDNTKITATTAASMKGDTSEVEGSTSLTLKGTSEAKLSGASVSVSADSTLDAKSGGTANFEGSMTTIKGSMITAG
ncbi:hypothetical protein [Enhygromyxa salina]|uniref:Uncharacterized protein n=1 Tax=Enhygromyxa salina TaxID=215803 RepID=A0A2S9YU86_9BACT|nr:hypothetical protein [Enhygromyxa salina]PRQ08675.1 hypothetical protein ENSA7_16200 [Enhygromyxa salina]